jgi:hypothetical protein
LLAAAGKGEETLDRTRRRRPPPPRRGTALPAMKVESMKVEWVKV